MASGGIRVSTEDLRAKSGELQGEFTNMISLFSDLKGQVEGTANIWIGEAGDAHRMLYARRLERIVEVYRRYEEEIKDLVSIAEVYETAETQIGSTIEALPASTLD